MTPASERIFRQHGKKLSAPQAYLEELADGRFGLFRAGQKSGKPQAIIDAADVVAWQNADLLQGDISLEISPQGRAHLRRFVAGGAFMAQHKGLACAAHDSAVTQTQTTPLQWLQARQKDKHFGLQDIEFEAGHRLAQDYDHAAYQPRQTMDWQRPVFVDGTPPTGEPNFAGSLLDARKKLDAALAYMGPGLSDVALAICCAEVGLEDCERGFFLPKRSAKLMLKMALMRLSVHYGLQSAAAAAASFRMR
jgi:hypothetical protein